MVKKEILKKSTIVIYVALIMLSFNMVNAQIFTLFNDTFSELDLDFENSTSHSFFMTLPNGNVVNAKMSLSGYPSTTQITETADVVLVTDVSGSMARTRLTNAKAADTLFVNTVDTNFIQVGLVKYSTCPVYSSDVLGLTDNKIVLNQTIASYTSGGWTNIGRGLEFAITELLSPRAQETDRKFILLMTDGEANYYYNQATNTCVSSESLARQYVLDMAEVAAENGIVIYGIGFGSGSGPSMELLINASIITGGQAYYVPSGQELQELYEEIAQTISTTTYPEPIINNLLPNGTISGWSSNQGLNQNATWNGSDCGLPTATCLDFSQMLQNAIDNCVLESCRVTFDLESYVPGTINIFDLFIEITPKANITCVDLNDPPTYVLTEGEYLRFPVSDVFNYGGEPGIPIEIIVDVFGGVDFINDELPENINATPNGLLGTDVSFIRIRTDQNIISSSCPVRFTKNPEILGAIKCAQPTPTRVLTNNNPIEIPLSAIFDVEGNPGTPQTLTNTIENGVDITSNFPDQSITATRTNLQGTRNSYITVRTNLGVYSSSCPITFSYINSMCGQPGCEQLIQAGNIEEIKASGCLDPTLNVYNNFELSRIYDIYPMLRYVDLVVDSFTVPIQPTTGNFVISPNGGPKEQVFNINGLNVPNGLEGVSVAKVMIPDMNGEEIIYCSLLVRINFNIIQEETDVDSDFLVTGSRAVSGYYNYLNEYVPLGPYIYTAKVWLRK